MDLGLKDRTVLVTGASRGIGRAIATTFAAEGANVAICARNEAPLAEAADDLRSAGVNVLTSAFDAADQAATQAFVERVAIDMGGIDIVVSNASPMVAAGDEHWDLNWQAHVMGFVHLVEATRPHLEKSDAASVVVIGSTSAVDTRIPNGINAYGITKTAAVAYAAVLARNLGPLGIRVNSVSPGNVKFPGGAWDERDNSKNTPELYDHCMASTPLGKFATPEDIAQAVAFISSPAAGHCTGTNLVVDGGFSARIQL